VGTDSAERLVTAVAQAERRSGLGAVTRVVDAAPQLTALLVGAFIWEVAARIAGLAFFPPLSDVVAKLVSLTADGLILGSLGASLLNLLIGFLVSVAAGIALGLLMGASRKVDVALDMYVNAGLTAPSLVFAPIFFSIFGLSRLSIVAVIIMYTVFIVIVTTRDAVRSVSVALMEMARCYGSSDRQLYLKIVFPASLPLIMAGVRLGAGRAVKGMVNGEMFISVVGLGALIMDAGRTFDAEAVLAVLVVVVLVSFGLVRILQLVDRRLNGWLPETART
jgi:ABC-type nitrate/sulfonate/bicarbonate transport system permease component